MSHPIKKYREENGLNLKAFGDLVDVQRSIVSKWETGSRPSVQNAIKIEAVTKRKIRKEDLRPDIWQRGKK